MSVTNPISIKYGDLTVGGSSAIYQIDGAFVKEQSYGTMRLAFDVIVLGETLADMEANAAVLEAGFRERLASGETLVITLDTASQSWTQGGTLLNAEASATKSGDIQRDRGAQRAYTCVITAELPADATADAGLRDLEVLVEKTPSRQTIVTMRGIYTATTSGHAQALYQANFDAVASGYLSGIKSGATFELAEESSGYDRHRTGNAPNPNLCPFTRQYVELLANQEAGIRDSTTIRDHRFSFRDEESAPGDAGGATRLRRCTGNFDCAVDIDQTTDLRDVVENTIVPHVKAEFVAEFDPSQFAVERFTSGVDKTGSRISCTFDIVYQGQDDDIVVEVTTSVTYIEQRTIDYTPVHGPNEFGMKVDPGWATARRVWERTIKAVGSFPPVQRLTRDRQDRRLPSFGIELGGIGGPGGSGLSATGWNLIESRSRSQPFMLGRPGQDQMPITILTEQVTEQYSEAP